MSLYPTYIVTFPRSGHHWLMRILKRYLGGELQYCESYTQPHLRMEVCPATNVQKTHDFKLDFVPPPGTRVLAQCRRDIAAALRSWHAATETWRTLPEFAAQQQAYWVGFLERWCSWEGEEPCVIWYEDLQANPIRETAKALHTLGRTSVDSEQLKAAVLAELNWPRLGIGEREAADPWPAI